LYQIDLEKQKTIWETCYSKGFGQP
jgi:hypothetical protein